MTTLQMIEKTAKTHAFNEVLTHLYERREAANNALFSAQMGDNRGLQSHYDTIIDELSKTIAFINDEKRKL